jgi:hypothetical protein
MHSSRIPVESGGRRLTNRGTMTGRIGAQSRCPQKDGEPERDADGAEQQDGLSCATVSAWT